MKNLTLDQIELVKEFETFYGILPEQIAFDGERIEPIFDFEALCVLRERLTDFQSIDVSQIKFDVDTKQAEAVCVILGKSGNVVKVSDFAEMGELFPDGSKADSVMKLQRLARARAMRTGIRAAGVNLLKAHRNYVENGNVLDFKPIDRAVAQRKEIHKLANELGLLSGSNRTEYENFLAETFEGRTSSEDLDEKERQRLIITFRAMRRVQNAGKAAA